MKNVILNAKSQFLFLPLFILAAWLGTEFKTTTKLDFLKIPIQKAETVAFPGFTVIPALRSRHCFPALTPVNMGPSVPDSHSELIVWALTRTSINSSLLYF